MEKRQHAEEVWAMMQEDARRTPTSSDSLERKSCETEALSISNAHFSRSILLSFVLQHIACVSNEVQKPKKSVKFRWGMTFYSCRTSVQFSQGLRNVPCCLWMSTRYITLKTLSILNYPRIRTQSCAVLLRQRSIKNGSEGDQVLHNNFQQAGWLFL